MSMTLPRLRPVSEWAPWTDRRGRLHPLRAVVFGLLLLPLLWLVVRWLGDMLGARGLNVAIHSTGYWAAWIVVASLVVSPAKALLGMPNIVVVRRMIGNAALCYAALHLVLYVADQNWRLWTVATEIVVRLYLTIGFVAFLGLVALGVTSTDGWVKRLGRDWKRLHKLAYALAVLGMIHFFLQSKIDVSQATVASGVLAWLLIWRVLPAGRDRGPVPLLLLAFGAAAVTLVFEYAWYRFGTKVDPLRIVRAEFDLTFGFRPAGLVLFMGVLVAGVTELRAVSQTRFGATAGYTMLVYALGALADDVAGFALGWDNEAGWVATLLMNAAWMALFALLGLARHRLREDWQRHGVDALWAAAAALPLLWMGIDNRQAGAAFAVVLVAATLLLTRRIWPVSRQAALLVAPLALLGAYEAFVLL